MGVVYTCQPGLGWMTVHPGACLTWWHRLLRAPALHPQVLPPCPPGHLAHDQRLGTGRLVFLQRLEGRGDEPGFREGEGAVGEQVPGAGQPGAEGPRQVREVTRRHRAYRQRLCDLVVQRVVPAVRQLRPPAQRWGAVAVLAHHRAERGEFARRRPRLHRRPPADDPHQRVRVSAVVPVIRARGRLQRRRDRGGRGSRGPRPAVLKALRGGGAALTAAGHLARPRVAVSLPSHKGHPVRLIASIEADNRTLLRGSDIRAGRRASGHKCALFPHALCRGKTGRRLDQGDLGAPGFHTGTAHARLIRVVPAAPRPGP